MMPTNIKSFAMQKNISNEFIVNQEVKGSRADLIEFTQMLRDNLEAGETIQDGIFDHAQKCKKPELATAFQNVGVNLLKGIEITEALSQYPGIFPREYRALIGAAKKSGRWTKKRHITDTDGVKEGILDLLLLYLNQADSARRIIIKGLIYPAIVLGLILAAIIILGIYVLPTFKEFFSALGAKPSFFSTILFGTADFVEHHYLLIPVALVILIAGGIAFWRSAGHKLWQHYQLNIPRIKELCTCMILAEIYWLMSVLYAAGLPIQDCLAITAETCRNSEVAAALIASVGQIQQGNTFADALKKSHQIFVGDPYRHISRAEKTGSLERMFAEQAAKMFERVKTQMDALLIMVEPTIMIVAGTVVGIIVASFYGTISELIGRLNTQ